MKITRQPKTSERRLVVTLARHERHTAATLIINKIKKQANNLAIAREYGASVRHETRPGAYTFLYLIQADTFLKASEKVPEIKPEQVEELREFVAALGIGRPVLYGVDTARPGGDFTRTVVFAPGRNVGRGYLNKAINDARPGNDGLYTPRIK